MLRSERIADLLAAGDAPGAKDPLVIAPRPDLDDLRKEGASSIDLRLGTWFVTLTHARTTHLAVDRSSSSEFTKTHYVPFGREYYLHPRSFVLGTTLEWMRLPKGLAGQVLGRSSWGRRGLIIATATGIHPGFRGCLTLELTNVGEIPVALRPGTRICQLSLFDAVGTESEHIDQSQFIGLRRPVLGSITSDTIERQLGQSPSWQTPASKR